MSYRVGIFRMAVLAMALGAVSCSRKEPDATPDGVVREWVQRMQRVHGNAEAAKAAYSLLSKPARGNLQERARMATAATGRKMEPEQMIVTSHFTLLFSPRQYQSRIAGDRAMVEVTGLDAAKEKASVPCVLEEDRWKVDLVLPPPPPVEKRADAGI